MPHTEIDPVDLAREASIPQTSILYNVSKEIRCLFFVGVRDETDRTGLPSLNQRAAFITRVAARLSDAEVAGQLVGKALYALGGTAVLVDRVLQIIEQETAELKRRRLVDEALGPLLERREVAR